MPMPPGRSSTGSPSVNATIVLSMPTSHAPPSRIIATASPRSSATCCAVVGETWPKRLADGAAMPSPPSAANAASNACATGCDGMRRPTLSWPPVMASSTCAARGRISVSGPGQNAAASAARAVGKFARPALDLRRMLRDARSPDDRTGRPFAAKIRRTASAIARVGAQAVDRFGRKRDEFAGAQAPRRVVRPRRASAPRSGRSSHGPAARGLAPCRGPCARRKLLEFELLRSVRARSAAQPAQRRRTCRRAQRGVGMSEFLFTSESVSEGHPDKVADQISDAVLDAILEQDPTGRVAAETLVSTGLVVMSGEITTKANVDYARVARETVRAIGYNDPELRFDADGCAVMVCYGRQSPDIAQGVDRASDDYLNQGAGDQGLMFGYACDETPSLMPFPIYYAHRLVQRQSEVRRDGRLPFLRPDAKSQVTVRYADGKPVARRHRRAVHAASPVDERQAGQARRGGDRGDHQAGVSRGHAEGRALPREPDRPLRDRRSARRRRAHGPQDHRRHLRRRGAARRRRVLRQGSVEGRPVRGLRGALRREEHRRRGDRARNARCRCRTRSAWPSRST